MTIPPDLTFFLARSARLRRPEIFACSSGRHIRDAKTRAASLAHVLYAVHRFGVYIPGAAAPVSRHIAEDGRADAFKSRATSADDFLAHLMCALK
jgi:hypothetical protein